MDLTFQVPILLFTASNLASITSPIHNWVLFFLWLHPFILSGIISPLITSSILGTYRPGEFIFQCAIFLPFHLLYTKQGFPGGSVVKNPPANAGDGYFVPGSGTFPGEGNGNPLQYSCLENPMDRRAWEAIVSGVTRVRHDLVH